MSSTALNPPVPVATALRTSLTAGIAAIALHRTAILPAVGALIERGGEPQNADEKAMVNAMVQFAHAVLALMSLAGVERAMGDLFAMAAPAPDGKNCPQFQKTGTLHEHVRHFGIYLRQAAGFQINPFIELETSCRT